MPALLGAAADGGGGPVPMCKCRLAGRPLNQVTRLARWALLPCLLLLVAFVLWCTPLPDPYYASCDRPCHELAWPMICRYKMSIETYQAMSGACGQCPANATHCHAAQCVSGDMSARGVMTANRMLPGPTLKVCENDIVVVDVVNRAMGQAMGVHWGGQSQREFPYMDGVPQLTQCPINTHTTFQYKFRAVGAGTHLWAAAGSPRAAASVFGPLVVQQPDNRDPHRQLYDEDVHVLTMSALGKAVLVNGHSELQVAPLVRGRRYRLRLLHAGGAADSATDAEPGMPGVATGPVTLSVAGLPLLAIAVDGHPVRPRSTRALTLWPGERVDAVLSADQPPSSSAAFVLAVHAEGVKLADAVVTLPFKEVDKKPGVQAASTPAPDAPDVSVADVLEGAELESLVAMPEQLAKGEVDVRLYLPFDFVPGVGLRSDLRGPQPHNKAGKTRLPMGLPDTPWPRAVPRVCNISLSLPAAPLLTQPRDAEAYDGEGGVAVCRGLGRPATCPSHLHGREDHSCECAHVIKVPLGSTVELVLADQGGDHHKAHVFQLHGYSFWLVGRGAESRTPSTAQLERGSWEALAAADRQGGLLRRHLHRAVLKDTVAVPALGAVALRFVADNPGYWLLREQSFFQWPSGLGVILQVGEESDLPPIPADFPKCGSFVGPEFFLM